MVFALSLILSSEIGHYRDMLNVGSIWVAIIDAELSKTALHDLSNFNIIEIIHEFFCLLTSAFSWIGNHLRFDALSPVYL